MHTTQRKLACRLALYQQWKTTPTENVWVPVLITRFSIHNLTNASPNVQPTIRIVFFSMVTQLKRFLPVYWLIIVQITIMLMIFLVYALRSVQIVNGSTGKIVFCIALTGTLEILLLDFAWFQVDAKQIIIQIMKLKPVWVCAMDHLQIR